MSELEISVAEIRYEKVGKKGDSRLAKILIAEDDEKLADNIADFLKRSEFSVDTAYSVDEAVSMIETFEYDLIILDWEFPDGAGTNIISSFRKNGGLTPILMLTGKSSIEDKEKAFEIGADDYLTKPFFMRELIARARALMRRAPVLPGDELKVGELVMKPASRKVFLDGIEVSLRPMEFSVLEFLMRNPGKMFAPEKIIDRVWESNTDVTVHAVYSCMKRLRQKLDRPGKESIIKNVPGHGYELGSGRLK